MFVKVQEIKELIATLMEKVEEIEDYQIELNFTTYWNVPFVDGQNLITPNPIANDLRDEWKTLKNRSYNYRRIGHEDFEMLGNIIKAVGLKIESIDENNRRKK